MNKKAVFGILGSLCVAASVAMYFMGRNDDKLKELNEFWWMPLPLAALLLLLAAKAK